jgi:hypothetical protein
MGEHHKHWSICRVVEAEHNFPGRHEGRRDAICLASSVAFCGPSNSHIPHRWYTNAVALDCGVDDGSELEGMRRTRITLRKVMYR